MSGALAIIIGLAFWAAWLLVIAIGVIDMILRGV
jgi:hypothetical protein